MVSAGDTLRGIALSLFGDAQLWYLIADANGLKSDADLQVGRNLTVPNKITNLRNASDTYKPYAPGRIIGDTTPTLPSPPPPPAPKHKKGGCGGVGMIVVAIVAIVAAVIVGPAVFAAVAEFTGSALLAGAAAGAVVNVVTQAAGLATGLQKQFSWSGVAMGAIGGAVAAGLNSPGSPLAGSGPGVVAARAVAGSVISQGIGVVVGAQKEFSWLSVAAAGVGAGVGVVADNIDFGGNTFARDLTVGLVSGAARQVVLGGKVNWANVAADAFGNALGNSIAYRSDSANSSIQKSLLDRARQQSGNGQLGSGIYGIDSANSASGFMLVDPNQPLPSTQSYENQSDDPLGDFINEKLQRYRPMTESYKALESLDGGMGLSGMFSSSAEKARVLAGSAISRELADAVEASSRYSGAGRAWALLGLSDSPRDIGVSVVMPEGDKPGYQKLRDMLNPDTGSLLNGYTWKDLTKAAMAANVAIVPAANGITNSPSQAFSNSLSLGYENRALGNDVIVVSAYNPTTSKTIDGIETFLIKGGTDTASVEASRIMIERAVEHNMALADLTGESRLAYTQVWGHSEGAAIQTQAMMEGMSPDALKMIDARLLGSPVGAAPAGLHSYINVGNINDRVAITLGRNLTSTGGVENSRGYIEGNAANSGSYKYETTDFVVDTPAGVSDENHSWQYYLSDPTTRSAFGLTTPLSASLREFYSRSYWKDGE